MYSWNVTVELADACLPSRDLVAQVKNVRAAFGNEWGFGVTFPKLSCDGGRWDNDEALAARIEASRGNRNEIGVRISHEFDLDRAVNESKVAAEAVGASIIKLSFNEISLRFGILDQSESIRSSFLAKFQSFYAPFWLPDGSEQMGYFLTPLVWTSRTPYHAIALGRVSGKPVFMRVQGAAPVMVLEDDTVQSLEQRFHAAESAARA